MSYQYNKKNLFQYSEDYMYSSYAGKSIIIDFYKSRAKFLKKFNVECKKNCFLESLAIKISYKFIKKKIHVNKKNNFYKKINFNLRKVFNIVKDKKFFIEKESRILNFKNKKIDFKLYLYGLINELTKNKKANLDLVIKKFEIKKRLFKFYSKGLKKGRYGYRSIDIYFLFSFLLCLDYLNFKRVKSLNTLIKVNDLITSNNRFETFKQIPQSFISLIILFELLFIKDLEISKKNI